MILSSNSQINKLKSDLKDNNILSSISCLSKTDDRNDLVVFKEHKLLLIPNQNVDLIEAFLNASKRLCSEDEDKKNNNYTSFLNVYVKTVYRLNQDIRSLLALFSGRGIRNFVFLISIILEKQNDAIFEHFVEELKKRNRDGNLEEFSANSEFGNHDLIGISNDTLFAITYLITEYSSLVNDTQIEILNGFDSEEEEENLGKAIFLASNINCFQHSLDKISFGEWSVQNVNYDSNKIHFTFSIIDKSLESARDLALRRLASQKVIRSSKKRELASMLESYALSIFDFAFDYCNKLSPLFLINNDDKYEAIKKKVLYSLNEIDVDDEIILWSNMDHISIVSSYLSAIALNIFAITSYSFSSHSKNSLDDYTIPLIPKDELASIINSTKIVGKYASENLQSYFTSILSRQSLNFFKAPFIEYNRNYIIAIDFLSQYNWTEWVRSNLMKGGKTADIVGRSWEKYVSEILKNNFWSKVESGVKLKENGRIITDVDIVAKRDNLLLLIQLKTYHGNGINAYEQWKFRKKIEHAVAQVKIAETTINSKPEILNNWFSQQELSEIKTIRSLVMTNSHLFNGWAHQGINIMSIGSLVQIINGANVKFVTGSGDVLGEKRYIKNEVITVDEFLEFIEKPLDWRIGNSEYNVIEHVENIADCILRIPILKHGDAINLRESLSEET